MLLIYRFLRKIKRVTEVLNSSIVLWSNFIWIKKRFNSNKVKDFKNKHKNEIIFCIGAGPSLNKENIQLLSNQTVIFTNSSYKLIDKVHIKNKYWFVQDQNRLRELQSVDRSIFDASFKSVHKLHELQKNTISRSDIFILPEIVYRWNKKILVPEIIEVGTKFSPELHHGINLAGNTVIFSAIQLAYYMGAKTIALLGVDMNYGSSSKDSYFDPTDNQNRYFWILPYEESTKPAFKSYKNFLESNAVQLINCTCETKEDVLNKMSLEQLLGNKITE